MKALIIGSGIAGPVTAMALQRAGIGSTVYEAYPPIEPEAGSYLTITPNGLEALRHVEALDLAMSAGFPTRRNVLWNQAGRRLASLPLASRLPDAPPAHTMKRSRLALLLLEEANRRGIEVAHGRRLIDARITSDGRVTAIFNDGGTADGDLLVGCDGVHSAARRIIDPTAPIGRYLGLTNFGGVTRGAADAFEPEAWHLIFGSRAFFGYQATPAGDVVWFANVPRPLIAPDERAATSSDGWKQQLIELFSNDVGPAAGLIEAGELELTADNTHDLGHIPTWHRGPLIIIGDAAHAPAPTSGQGASMAIEDGIVLAHALRAGSTIPKAFKAYEEQRRERVEKIVAWGARGSGHKVPGPFGRFARDVILRLLFRYVITDKSLGWMYDYRINQSSSYQAR